MCSHSVIKASRTYHGLFSCKSDGKLEAIVDRVQPLGFILQHLFAKGNRNGRQEAWVKVDEKTSCFREIFLSAKVVYAVVMRNVRGRWESRGRGLTPRGVDC